MTDLISRAAAIDEIKALYEWHDIVTEDRAIEHFKKLPSAQPEQQWIPCSERLPEYGGWYITTYRITKDNNKRVGLLWYSTAHGWEWDNAIAWMPLPESYREE